MLTSKNSHRLAATAISLSALLCADAALATDGYFSTGYGQQSKGLGGVVLAYPKDTLALAENPASVGEISNRVDFGIDYFSADRHAVISNNGAGANGHYAGNGGGPSPIPEFGLTHKIDDRLAIGVAVYGNGGMATHYAANPFASFGASGPAGVSLSQLFVSPALSYQLAPGQSIGVAANLAAQQFKAFGVQPFAGYSAAPGQFSNHGYQTSLGTGFRVGYLGHFGKSLSLGAYYQSKTSMEKLSHYSGLFEDSGAFDIPQSYGVGAAYAVTPALDLVADVKRIDYSGVKAVGDTLAPLFTGTPFGTPGGPGFGWRDVTAIKVGANYRLSPSWQVRAGYSHSDNPVPRSQTLLNILAPGVVTNQFTLGATWTASSGLELSGYVLDAPKHTVNGSGSIPAPFGGGEASVSLGELVVGVGAGLKY